MLKDKPIDRSGERQLETVNYYEKWELLPKPARSDSGYRLYSESDIGKVSEIVQSLFHK
ncbi:MerR family transcriptional regulator [Paenibacillus sp. NEAU-GSW1]|uniref:MerR family transcriptional regulator n=1 Tax=Paenibacillus sp. NEAU-GSW1 TaxID=2682486 RepID=UPI00139C420D|nr:MerR family transcriptional regulator [Paenibacillus sp. NEAU-GSW1]